MNSIVRIYSKNTSEIKSFLELFFSEKIFLEKTQFFWQQEFKNPVELADIVAAFIDNKDKYPQSNMWICLDKNVFINIRNNNYNLFIKYLFERYPY